MTTFAELGLSTLTIEALARKGFEEPTPIQIQCLEFFVCNKENDNVRPLISRLVVR